MAVRKADVLAAENPRWSPAIQAGAGLPGRDATAADYSQQVLRTDVAGMPLEWIDYREAVRLYYMEQVAYSCGSLLYRRDANLCLYCGDRFMSKDLTRDHVTPLSRGGNDSWTNCVTACRRCNNLKGGRVPEQADMQLIAVPFTPTYAEYIYLKGRRVLADQMQFLLAHIPRSSPLHQRLASSLRARAAI